jgi:hypothetical protein
MDPPLLNFENGMAFRSLVLFPALPLCQGKKAGNPNLFKAIENPKNS